MEKVEKAQAVFGTFVVREYYPWKDYDEPDADEYRHRNCSLAVMMLRYDGKKYSLN